MRRVYGSIAEDPERGAAAFAALFVSRAAQESRAMPGPDDNDPLIRYGAPLAAVLIAVVVSVMVAAMLAGQLEGDYSTRALVYTGLVLWVLVGAVVMFILAHRSEGGRLSPGRVLLWAATIWLWPVFALLAWQGRK
jgi:lysylphosphatidylglycerol synthetase-like protein (DUF2156 family)